MVSSAAFLPMVRRVFYFNGFLRQPLAQLREILLHVGNHFRAGAERLVFVMLAEGAVVGGSLELGEEALVHRAFAKIAPDRLPAFRGFFPAEILEEDRDVKRLEQAGLDGPGKAALERGVADVEAHADVLRIE